MSITKEQKQALKYQGLLGHEFVVLDSQLRGSMECNTLESARKEAGSTGLIFQQLPKRQWKRIV